MTDEERQEIEEMIAVKLCKEIDRLFMSKGINAKRTGASTDNDFLYLDLLVDMPDSARIIKVEIRLDKTVLYSKGCCSELDRWGGYHSDKMSLVNLVKVRILKVVFDVCKMIKNKTLRALDTSNNLKVAFADKSGHI